MSRLLSLVFGLGARWVGISAINLFRLELCVALWELHALEQSEPGRILNWGDNWQKRRCLARMDNGRATWRSMDMPACIPMKTGGWKYQLRDPRWYALGLRCSSSARKRTPTGPERLEPKAVAEQTRHSACPLFQVRSAGS